MNDAPELINIFTCHPNPFQVRQAEDPIVVAELAANIEKNGLLQPITVRPIGEQYEIAFGHTRRAAFKLLEQQGKMGFSAIPAFVRDLDDLQMFELAVAENIKRRDLNPIERARAMQTYMDKFQKTSAETGEFFSCDEATVRGSVRLLGLPEAVQAKVSNGAINVGAARSLLTLQKLAPEDVEVVSERIINGGEAQKEVVNQLRSRKNTQMLQESYQDRENPTAGDNLWRLDLEKFPDLPHLTTAFAQDANAIDEEGGKFKRNLQEWINRLESGLLAPEALIAQGAPLETVERLMHLINPPACSVCGYHLQADHAHFCGWKSCWQRKLASFMNQKVKEGSKKMIIPPYDPETDGEFVGLGITYQADKEEEKWFEERIPGLRLKGDPKSYGAWEYTHSKLVRLVDVTPEHVQARKDASVTQEKENAARKERYLEDQSARVQTEELRDRSNIFMTNVVIPVFSQALESLKSESMLKALARSVLGYGWEDVLLDEDGNGVTDPKTRIYNLRCGIMADILTNDGLVEYALMNKGPEEVAQFLMPVANEWGVLLPSDWFEKAQVYTEKEPEPEVDPENEPEAVLISQALLEPEDDNDESEEE